MKKRTEKRTVEIMKKTYARYANAPTPDANAAHSLSML
jgi:hypothetical protein